MSDLPAYTPVGVPPPIPVKRSMAGPVQTCSIEDRQYDYFRLTRDSPSSYQISLTVDPTPLYRVEISQDPSAVADIQLFAAFNSNTAEAACKIPPKPAKGGKKEPVATICTILPLSPSARWFPLEKSSGMNFRECYAGTLPLVMVPGCRPVLRNFSWRLGQTSYGSTMADVELWVKDLLPPSRESVDRGQLFAQYYSRTTRFYEKGILEIRRGGGLEFEFGVIMGVVAVLELMNRG